MEEKSKKVAGLVLSTFTGIDLLGLAFEEEGYCVVCGPELLWGHDAYNFHPPSKVFQGIIGGPPCQTFSRMRHLLKAVGKQPRYGNLIPEFERIIKEVWPEWFLMENVPDAPIPEVEGYKTHSFILNNRWVGGIQHRERRFSFGTQDGRYLQVEVVLFEEQEWTRAVLGNQRQVPLKLGKNGKPKKVTVLAADTPTPGQRRSGEQYMNVGRMCELQGLPADFMRYSPFRVDAQKELIGNGVPLPLGRAIARAVKKCFTSCAQM